MGVPQGGMGVPLLVAGVTIATLNFLLHCLGLYLLNILRKGSLKGSQTILIIHLSLSEVFLSIMQGSKHVATLCKVSDGDGWSIYYDYATVAEYTGFAIIYYLVMIYITLYRCAKLFLGIKYSLYWSNRKTSVLCICTWIFGSILCMTIGLLKYFYNIQYIEPFFKFVYPPTEAIFLALTFVTYTAIFQKYRRSIARFQQNFETACERKRQLQKTITAKFYIPSLLIITFILFMVVPDMIVLIYFIILKNESKLLDTIITMMYTLSVTSDGIIYIFLQKIVRRLLLAKLHILKWKKDSTLSDAPSQILYLKSPVPSRARSPVSPFATVHNFIKVLSPKPTHGASNNNALIPPPSYEVANGLQVKSDNNNGDRFTVLDKQSTLQEQQNRSNWYTPTHVNSIDFLSENMNTYTSDLSLHLRASPTLSSASSDTHSYVLKEKDYRNFKEEVTPL